MTTVRATAIVLSTALATFGTGLLIRLALTGVLGLLITAVVCLAEALWFFHRWDRVSRS